MNGLVTSKTKRDIPISFAANSCVLLFKKLPSTQRIKIAINEYVSACVCCSPKRINGSDIDPPKKPLSNNTTCVDRYKI